MHYICFTITLFLIYTLAFFTFINCTFPRSTLIDATFLHLHYEASFHITWLFQQYITGSYGLRRYRRMTTTKNMTLSGRWWIILPSHRRPLELRPLPSDASTLTISVLDKRKREAKNKFWSVIMSILLRLVFTCFTVSLSTY